MMKRDENRAIALSEFDEKFDKGEDISKYLDFLRVEAYLTSERRVKDRHRRI
ncbi:hypothetical protein [Hydrogenimonas cancrithermarum]|uniref:Uncharacterized protein n=1 Tax=Hydrogenimonas cancrithermarum TaxID=2993563 RepID=A0ABN6WWT0_9BACT|nr:hypothetical protein [Hydrogenimonas cancrithermarum]BDY13408.1 hypothetical protein HCR_17200 [Hydrogenimonas cancrithermarum]